uniref:NADH dehydrogenase [ubiquinone] iron-sulfur protein 4, mitochondrial n=1 Tax=Strombidium rassoulzadegani TaxID=1082188 RepID=A0A7S3G0P5_9SPIT|mmetsp:Transcript_8691/g.14740  ORF Transcript_8691/g.14740 Transcript_8691/m.14740 type:complete len:140 (+) Transcript_8691:243-662(+)
MRPHQGIQSSGAGFIHADPTTDSLKFQDRVVRIYMPQKKHVHTPPADKTIGKYWMIDYEPVSTFKSPLMQWSSATIDPFDSKGDSAHGRFPSVESAISYAKMMGWGYEVQYPRFKYLTKKNYQDNFAYKGEPKPEADYD